MKSRHYVDVIVLWVLLMVALSVSWDDKSVTGFLIARGDAIPAGFGAPYDVFNGNQIVSASYASGKIEASTANADWTYDKGYYYDGNTWNNPFTFQGPKVCSKVNGVDQCWINTQQNTPSASVSAQLPQGRNYVAAFTCRKVGAEWKCGCRTQTECGKWQVQSFEISALPTPPVAAPLLPGNECGNVLELVCGNDGVTYNNLCELAKAGTTKKSDGPCAPPAGGACTDTDGGEIPDKRGTVTDKNGVQRTDSCVAGQPKVTEWFCGSGGSAAQLIVTCTSGSCQDGACGTETTPTPTALTASCSASPNPAQINSQVTFTASPSGGTQPYTYTWSRDAVGSTRSATATFTTAGTKTAAVQVRDTSTPQKTATASCSVVVQAEATGNIVVRAKSDMAQNAGAQFDLDINGNVIGTKTATATFAEHSFTFSGTINSLRIIYKNDLYNTATGEDRNLWIDYVTISGQKYEAESGFVIDTAGNRQSIHSSGTAVIMWKNSALVLKAGTGTCTDTDNEDPFIKGNVIDKNGAQRTDACVPGQPNKVTEWFCGSDGEAKALQIMCTSGSCQDGACGTQASPPGGGTAGSSDWPTISRSGNAYGAYVVCGNSLCLDAAATLKALGGTPPYTWSYTAPGGEKRATGDTLSVSFDELGGSASSTTVTLKDSRNRGARMAVGVSVLSGEDNINICSPDGIPCSECGMVEIQDSFTTNSVQDRVCVWPCSDGTTPGKEGFCRDGSLPTPCNFQRLDGQCTQEEQARFCQAPGSGVEAPNLEMEGVGEVSGFGIRLVRAVQINTDVQDDDNPFTEALVGSSQAGTPGSGSATVKAAGGTPPYTWRIESSSFQAGELALNAQGDTATATTGRYKCGENVVISGTKITGVSDRYCLIRYGGAVTFGVTDSAGKAASLKVIIPDGAVRVIPGSGRFSLGCLQEPGICGLSVFTRSDSCTHDGCPLSNEGDREAVCNNATLRPRLFNYCISDNGGLTPQIRYKPGQKDLFGRTCVAGGNDIPYWREYDNLADLDRRSYSTVCGTQSGPGAGCVIPVKNSAGGLDYKCLPFNFMIQTCDGIKTCSVMNFLQQGAGVSQNVLSCISGGKPQAQCLREGGYSYGLTTQNLYDTTKEWCEFKASKGCGNRLCEAGESISNCPEDCTNSERAFNKVCGTDADCSQTLTCIPGGGKCVKLDPAKQTGYCSMESIKPVRCPAASEPNKLCCDYCKSTGAGTGQCVQNCPAGQFPCADGYCRADCANPFKSGICGDYFCDVPKGETIATCPQDCTAKDGNNFGCLTNSQCPGYAPYCTNAGNCVECGSNADCKPLDGVARVCNNYNSCVRDPRTITNCYETNPETNAPYGCGATGYFCNGQDKKCYVLTCTSSASCGPGHTCEGGVCGLTSQTGPSCGDSACNGNEVQGPPAPGKVQCDADCRGSANDGYCNAAAGENLVTAPNDCRSVNLCSGVSCGSGMICIPFNGACGQCYIDSATSSGKGCEDEPRNKLCSIINANTGGGSCVECTEQQNTCAGTSKPYCAGMACAECINDQNCNPQGGNTKVCRLGACVASSSVRQLGESCTGTGTGREGTCASGLICLNLDYNNPYQKTCVECYPGATCSNGALCNANGRCGTGTTDKCKNTDGTPKTCTGSVAECGLGVECDPADGACKQKCHYTGAGGTTTTQFSATGQCQKDSCTNNAGQAMTYCGPGDPLKASCRTDGGTPVQGRSCSAGARQCVGDILFFCPAGVTPVWQSLGCTGTLPRCGTMSDGILGCVQASGGPQLPIEGEGTCNVGASCTGCTQGICSTGKCTLQRAENNQCVCTTSCWGGGPNTDSVSGCGYNVCPADTQRPGNPYCGDADFSAQCGPSLTGCNLNPSSCAVSKNCASAEGTCNTATGECQWNMWGTEAPCAGATETGGIICTGDKPGHQACDANGQPTTNFCLVHPNDAACQ